MTDALILDIDLSGLAAVETDIEGFQHTLNREMTIAMQASLQFLEGQIAARTPVNTGQLRSSITHQIISGFPNLAGVVGSPLPYSIVVEFGRRPDQKMPPVDAIKVWAIRKLGIPREEADKAAWAIAKHIAKYGIQGQFMFKEGLEVSQPSIQRLFDNAIARAVQQANQ